MYVVTDGKKQRIPRFYKDKLFTNKATNELRKLKGMEEQNKMIQVELERLTRLDPRDPFQLLEERIRYEHDNVKLKANLKDKM